MSDISSKEPWEFDPGWDIPSPARYFVGLLQANDIWPKWTDYAANKLGGWGGYYRRG